MKRICKLLALVMALLLALGAVSALAEGVASNASKTIKIDKAHFPDKTFREIVKYDYDPNGDGKLTEAERKKVKSIFTGSRSNIYSLKGIELFPNLESLDCSDNEITSIDLSKNTKLKSLTCYQTSLTKLDVSKLTKLEYLNIGGGTPIKKLNLKNNTNLKRLNISDSSITNLDLSKNKKLEELFCVYSGIKKLDVSKNTKLKALYCTDTKLTTLDVSKNVNLVELDCALTQIKKLDVKKNKKLEILGCSYTKLTQLNLSKNTKLHNLSCYCTNITKLDLANQTNLVNLVKKTKGSAYDDGDDGVTYWEKGKNSLWIPYNTKLYNGKKKLYGPGDVDIAGDDDYY